MEILITGASRGIGAALARELTDQGHRVVLISRNAKKLEQICRSCNEAAGEERACFYAFDLSDLQDLEGEFVTGLQACTTGIDALVNNAGQLINKPFADTGTGEAKALFEANFFAPAALIRLCLSLMEGSPLKHIVNVTSMGGFQGSSKFPGLSYYSASKAALGSLTECLSQELKDEGYRVNALALGSVQTEMLAEAFPGLKAGMKPSKMAEFLSWFVLEGSAFFQGKVLPVSRATP
jgi:short-subunit dehydrogenase